MLIETSTNAISQGESSVADPPVQRSSERHVENGATSFVGAVSDDEAIERGRQERDAKKWGLRFKPPVPDVERSNEYKRLATDLAILVRQLAQFVKPDGTLADEGLPVVVEIQGTLEALYSLEYGVDEYLKQISLVVLSQIKNARYSSTHVRFLMAVATFLESQYLIDETALKEVFKIIGEYGLSKFRGTITETPVLRQYRIVESE